ncbi:THAP domain-containing protein 8 isoform X1 [Mustela erminea]|uniref:THAP domain-containing protein 8 isoform X1 n=2 Tax=Mustela erminea TaxID=36723 RepID=UPI001386A228|nr:THAP domain-containing protein 8 isoform X1 [Mustela erminea]
MPKYCRAPNCSNTAGRLGADNRPVSFYKFPLKDGPRLQAWLRHMGHEDWEPSCHQHLCSEHFTPSCFQWRWGVRYLRPDAVPSIFSPAPPAKKQQSSRSTEKPVVPPSPPEGTPLSPGPAVSVSAPGPVPLVVLGSASGAPEAMTTVFLTPLPPPPAPAGQQPGVRAQHPLARLDAVLGALRRRVRSLQRRQEQHELRLRALEQLAQQLCREGPLSPMEKQAPGRYSNLPEVRQPRRCTTRIQARGLTPQQASALLLESSLPGP